MAVLIVTEVMPLSYRLERREKEEAERIHEENRIADLKAYCEKKGLDFETENAKALKKLEKKKKK